GRKSTDLHLNHKKVEPYGGILEEVKPRSLEIPLRELYRVAKMEFPRVKGKVGRSTIIYNTWITLPNTISRKKPIATSSVHDPQLNGLLTAANLRLARHQESSTIPTTGLTILVT